MRANDCVFWQEASQRWLNVAVWLQAFDGYALAAHALDQMKFSAAMSHKCIVQELASSAGAEGRKPLLGIVYDDVARWARSWFVLVVFISFACSREWEDMAGKRREKFDVNVAALKLDDALLRKVCASSACIYKN